MTKRIGTLLLAPIAALALGLALVPSEAQACGGYGDFEQYQLTAEAQRYFRDMHEGQFAPVLRVEKSGDNATVAIRTGEGAAVMVWLGKVDGAWQARGHSYRFPETLVASLMDRQARHWRRVSRASAASARR